MSEVHPPDHFHPEATDPEGLAAGGSFQLAT